MQNMYLLTKFSKEFYNLGLGRSLVNPIFRTLKSLLIQVCRLLIFLSSQFSRRTNLHRLTPD